MVTTVAKPTLVPSLNGVTEKLRESPHAGGWRGPLICPRCDARLRISYDEPICLQCGYVNYHYTPTNGVRKASSLMTAGTRSVLRYVGDSPALAETLTQVRLVRLRNRGVYEVNCPFCDGTMEQSSLSGKRREAREERYRCEQGHRVSLTPGKNGFLGWK